MRTGQVWWASPFLSRLTSTFQLCAITLSFDDSVVLQPGPLLTGGSPSPGPSQRQGVKEEAAPDTGLGILGPQQSDADPGMLRHWP